MRIIIEIEEKVDPADHKAVLNSVGDHLGMMGLTVYTSWMEK